MADREKLPGRRNTLVIEVRHQVVPVTVQVGFFDDWRIGEFFISDATTVGSYVNVAARNFAVLSSIALQRGASLEELFGATMKTPDGKPDGIEGTVLAALIKLQGEVRGQ